MASLGKRIKRMSVVLLVLVLVVLLLSVLWLRSSGGQAFLREQVVKVVKGSIAGRLEFERVDFEDGHLVLEGLELYTPEGELVMSVKRAELDVDVAAAVRKDFRLSRVRLEQPHVVLVQDERGLNFMRAIASKTPSTEPGSPLKLTVEGVELVDGDASFTDGTRTVRLEQLAAKAKAVVTTQPLTVVSSLELTAMGTDPVKGPVTLTATTTSPKPDTLHVFTDLHFGDEVVKGTFDWPETASEVDEVRVTPALVQSLTGSTALRQTVVLKGKASLKGAKLEATGGKAKVSVTGAWDLDAKSISSFELQGDDIDLSEWLVGGKSSRLSLTAKGSAPNLALEQLTGDLDAQATWKTPEGVTLGQADVQLTAKAGQAQVKKLFAKVPGAEVKLNGRASLSTLNLSGTLLAQDLSKLDSTVVEFTGTHLPPLAGRGSLALQVTGPTKHPKVVVQGQLDDLRVSTLAAKSLVVDVTVPDVTKPLDADGTLFATKLTLGTQTFEELRAAVTTHGRELDVTMTTKGFGNLGLSMHGTLDADSSGLAVASLQVDTGIDRWTLSQPTRIDWEPVIAIAPLTLTSGRQELRLEGELKGKNAKAEVHAADVDLSRLPKFLVPATLGLAGVVSLDASVDGALPLPNVVAKLTVKDGAAKGVTQVSGTVDGRFVDGRATGTAQVSSSLGAIDGRFDVPVFALRDEQSDLLEVDAEVRDVSLEAIQSWRAETWPVTGTLSGHLSAKGPANDPAITITTRSEKFTLTRTGELQQNLVLEPVVLTIATNDDGKLTAKVEASTLGAVVTSTLATPFTVPGLRRELPTFETFKTTALTFDATIDGLALEKLKGLGVKGFDDVTGRTSVKAHVVGSLDDPKGQVTLDFERVNAAPLEDLDGTLVLTAGDTVTRLSGKGRMMGKPLYDLDLFVDTTLAKLEHVDALGAEHVTGHLSLTPMQLSRLLPKRDDEVMPTGAVSLELDMKGTLADPKLTIDGAVQGLSFGKVPLGQARLVSRTQGKAQSIGLTLKASGNSELRATGTVGVDLSIASLRKGLSLTAIPLDLSVVSKDFDLGFLSGVTPMVRIVGGQLTLSNFKVKGLSGNPDIGGEVAWKKGRLGLASYGDYRDIDLETVVSRERIEVQTLSVRAGGGGFAMNPLVAVRGPTGIWSFESSGTATRFPIVTEDQLLAILSVKYELNAEISEGSIELPKISLSRVDVELPEVKRKDIQDLERPKDLVIVRGGRTIAGRRRGEAAKQASTTSSMTVRAVIDAPRNIWLRSSDLNLELGLSEGFRVEYTGETQLFGEAQVLGGRIDVIGREFKVVRANTVGTRSDSTVRFAGPAKLPYVNVTALHTNDREKVKVTVNVVGRGTDVVLKVSSDPSMSESDIYTLLATGRRDLRRSSGAITAEQAVSVIGSLAANQLKSALLKRLPIDIVDVVSIETGAEGLESTRVEVGKYLSDSLYLGYVGQPGANKARGESVHTGRLELQVSKDVSLQASGGVDAPAFGADIVWSRDF